MAAIICKEVGANAGEQKFTEQFVFKACSWAEKRHKSNPRIQAVLNKLRRPGALASDGLSDQEAPIANGILRDFLKAYLVRHISRTLS